MRIDGGRKKREGMDGKGGVCLHTSSTAEANVVIKSVTLERGQGRDDWRHMGGVGGWVGPWIGALFGGATSEHS